MAALDVYKDWLGIPDGPRPPDQYTLLRLVKFEDNTDKVRTNYKKLNGHVRKYATGQYSVRSQELLNEMAKAMLCLTDPERKREYDESLGREFPEEPGVSVPMERILAKQGHITREQAKEAVEFSNSRGLSMRDAVVQMKLVTAEIATQALAEELKLPFVDLEDVTPDDDVLDQVPKALCSRNSMLPLFIDGDKLMVACADEPTHQCEDELRLRFGVPIRRVLATPSTISAAVAKFYAPGVRDDAGSKPAKKAETVKPAKKAKGKDESAAAEPAPVKKAAAAEVRVRFSQLSDDDQKQRKQLGMMFMMWSFIGSALIDSFFLNPSFKMLKFMGNMPSLTTLVVVPIVVIWVTQKYWK